MAFLATSIYPATGSAGGGNTVYITGTDLDDVLAVTGVKFGATNATSWEIRNPNLLAVVVPAHAAGAVNVVVTDGTTPTTLTGAYSFSAIDTTEELGSTVVKKWRVDINTGTSEDPVWTRLRAMASFQPTLEPTSQDDSDYDSGDYGSDITTQLKWGVTAKLLRKIGVESSIYDPGQEALRAKSGKTGAAGLIPIRYYDKNGGPEAYQGLVSVGWSPDGGDTTALDTVTCTLKGNGDRHDIANPAA